MAHLIRIASRSLRSGEINEQILMTPDLEAIMAMAAVLRMFSQRSAAVKPRSLQSSSLRPSLSIIRGVSLLDRLKCLAIPCSIVDLPEPDKSVIQMTLIDSLVGIEGERDKTHDGKGLSLRGEPPM